MVVGHALCALLEGSGYDTTPLDAYPTGIVDELLDGSDLLLVVPRLDAGVRDDFLGAMGKVEPQTREMPVVLLSTTSTMETLSRNGVLSIPWPCTTEDLVDRIEAAILRRYLPLNERG